MAIKTEMEGAERLLELLGKIKRGMNTREIMGKMAANAVTAIKDRTLEGKDAKGKDFEGYSDKYLAFKKERGAEFFSGGVNLFDGGDMLGSMQHTVRTSKKGRVAADIIFTRSSEALKASGHHVGNPKRGLPKREFFSLGADGRMAIAVTIKKHLEELLES